MHARLGEILYMSASQSGGPDQSPVIESVTHAMRQFCRSIELCDDYLRGYYGLKVVSTPA